MLPPRTVADVWQFCMAANWLWDKIPAFSAVAAPLQAFYNTALADKKRRNLTTAARIPVESAGWNDTLAAAFHGLREAAIGAVTLANYDPSKLICLSTPTPRTSSGLQSSLRSPKKT